VAGGDLDIARVSAGIEHGRDKMSRSRASRSSRPTTLVSSSAFRVSRPAFRAGGAAISCPAARSAHRAQHPAASWSQATMITTSRTRKAAR
jgi:hypothetical protein